MLIWDLPATSALTSHNHKIGPSRFGDPMTRLSEPGPGQWVAKTQVYTCICIFVCVIMVTYLPLYLQVELKNTPSGNFKNRK